MSGSTDARVEQMCGTSAESGSEDEPLGLLGESNTGEEDGGNTSRPVEVHADVEAAETTYTWTYENGRRYASPELGHYYMPNDEPEVQRLNEQHWTFTQVRGGHLHLAPLPKKDGLRILDVGCGSGIWCVQMAAKYHRASIFGMDVSPIQPKTKPANVCWEVQDMESDWPYPENYFDLVHLSLVHGCVEDWTGLLGKIRRHLAPRGYVEHQELSLCRQYLLDEKNEPVTMPDRTSELSPFFRWGRLMEQAGKQRGRPIQLGPHLATMQVRAGFHPVAERVFPHKWGNWPSDPRERSLGARTMRQTVDGMEGFTTAMFTKTLGWSLEDTQRFILEVKRDMQDDRLRKVVDLYVVYGQKPAPSPPRRVEEPNDGPSVSAALVESPGLQLGTLVVAAIGASFVAAFAHWVVFTRA